MSGPTEDWILETDEGPLVVSWPEPGDAIDDPPAHHLGAQRVSFGYSAVDAPKVEQLRGSLARLSDSHGHQLRVWLERIDPELKVVVGEVVESTGSKARGPRAW